MTWPKDEALLFYTEPQMREIAADADLDRLRGYDANEVFALWVLIGRMYADKCREVKAPSLKVVP